MTVFILIALLCMGLLTTTSSSASNNSGQKPKELTVFTHGDTIYAQFQPEGSVTGMTTTMLDCAAKKTGVPYRYSRAPLSRAASIVATTPDAVWFPAAHRGDETRMSRSIGPVVDVNFMWYQLKSSTADPNSDAFKASAKVTAYRGSNLEEKLRSEGYDMVLGSADHNRLIYMVMAGEVDAVLAVDFRPVLTPETRRIVQERMRTTLRNKVPVSFLASEPLVDEYPEFFTELQTAIMDCKPG